MSFIVKNEGLLGLFKGIGPQIMKGFLVQGILMMAKERYVPSTPPPSPRSLLPLTTLTELSYYLFSSSDGLRISDLKRFRRLPLRLLARQRPAQLCLPRNRIECSNGVSGAIRQAAFESNLYSSPHLSRHHVHLLSPPTLASSTLFENQLEAQW